jgi:Protein of unknown function (DUF3540)
MNAAVRFLPRPVPMAHEYLGAAEVTGVELPTVFADVPGVGPSRAELAFALPYAPVVGDVLLVIARGDACFAIGVLRGSGRTSLSLEGDVDLHAEGRLRLTAGEAVELRAPELEVHAGKLRMLAGAVVQRFASVCQRVERLLSVHAGETHTLVDGATFAQSRSAAILTEETATINGRQIHIG